jgi:hypothetical protein
MPPQPALDAARLIAFLEQEAINCLFDAVRDPVLGHAAVAITAWFLH